jgi:tetratricopeptide (TPR) repeat protein
MHLALAWEWLWRSHVVEGRRWLESFLQHRSTVPIALQVKTLNTIGDLATIQGDYARAQRVLAESLALTRELEDKQGIARALDLLGFIATAQEDYPQALEFLQESRALFQELGHTMAVAVSLIRQGDVLSLQGNYAGAMALCQESLALAQERDHTPIVGWAFHALGTLALRQGDAGQARALLAKGLAVFQEAGDLIGLKAYLEVMAEVAGLEGQPERLVRLFGAVEPLRSRLGASSYTAEQIAYKRQLLVARTELGEASFDAAWTAGRAMTLEQAIAEALGEA